MESKLTLAKTFDDIKTKDPHLTVVLIHGIASDSSTYDNALASFKDVSAFHNIRFVTFDLLGSGKSAKSDELNYDYADQLEALHNAIAELEINTPLILVGHSLGTFIVTRYAKTYPDEVKNLVLISPPVYTPADFDNPAFALGIEAFKKAISVKNLQILKEKSFNNSIDKIVMDRNNYNVLTKISIPTLFIYGDEDQLIASYNVPALLKVNPKITAIKTHGRHGVSKDKYAELETFLVGELYAETA